MKINPVQGIPTIPKPSPTGLSPEKIERLKAIASGKKPEELTAQPQPEPQETVNNTVPRIKMNVNRTVHRNGDLPTETPPTTPPETPQEGTEIGNGAATEGVISDTGVQTKSEPEAIKPISPQLAELARQKRALQVKESEIAEREKALEGKDSSALIERLKSQPLSVLQEYGVTYDKLTEDILASQGSNAEIAALKAEIAALRNGIDERFTQQTTEQEQAVYDHIKRNIDSLTFSSDDYKFIREAKAQDEVLERIKKAWEEKQIVMDETEAMQIVENELREDARRFAKLIGEIDAPTPTPAQPVPQQTGAMKTITNKDSARPPMSRRQRAIAAALGQK